MTAINRTSMKKTGLLLSLLTLLWYCGAAQTPGADRPAQFLPAVGRIEAAGTTRTWNCAGRRYPARKATRYTCCATAKSRCAERPPEPLLPRLRRRTRPQRSLYVPCGGARRRRKTAFGNPADFSRDLGLFGRTAPTNGAALHVPLFLGFRRSADRPRLRTFGTTNGRTASPPAAPVSASWGS